MYNSREKAIKFNMRVAVEENKSDKPRGGGNTLAQPTCDKA